ncbi:MAG: carboxypeptidase-like regulatory domain-containing protein, partial [Paludibacteraceae bacterium]|nr:carboxypeptidase-like regulatory domain-containing protein [Paludibacteraceae bacterium]
MIFLALAPLVHIQAEDYRIYGYVYLPDREPASFTTITVEGTTTGTTAREDGYYDLRFSATDSARVRFQILGCKPYIYNITPKTRKSIQKMVYLEDDAIMMKDVEVTDFAKQSTSMNKIDVSKLDVMPSVNGGIEGLISTYAGVSNRNELSSQYSVRGGNYDENSVYVNDIEVYRPLLIRTGEQEGLSFINPDMVEGVEFSAGGYGATYGDKMSSVLDIKYKKPKRFEASVAASLLGAQGHVGHSTKNGKFTQLHGIRYKSSDYMFNTMDTKGMYDQKFLDYQTYLTFNFAKKWEIDFLGNFSRNIYNNIPESRTTTYGTLTDVKTFRMYFDGQEKDIFQTEFGALTLKYSPISSLNLKLIASAYESHESVNYDLIGEYWIGESMGNGFGEIDESAALGVGAYQEYTRNRLRVRVIKAEHRGDYTINKNTISWGASLQKEDIDDNIIEFETRDSSGYVTSTYNRRSKTSMNSWRTQFFVQDESRFKTRIGTIGVLAGIRGNYWPFNKEFIVSPRATLSYFPKKNENLGFRFSTGVYYQSPFYKEVRLIDTDEATGNSNVRLNDKIKSQRSLHFVLGGDYYFRLKGRPFKFTTEVYYKMADRVETYSINNLKIVYSGTN